MSKTLLPIEIEVIESLAEEVKDLFEKENKTQLKPFQELNSTDFEKNNNHKLFKNLIGRHNFHPKKLYTYIFEPIRFKNERASEKEQNYQDKQVNWKITRDFPKLIFQMLGYTDLSNFLIKNKRGLSPDVIARQKKHLDHFKSKSQNKTAKIVRAYHCYISELQGLKTARLAIYNTGQVEMQLSTEDKIDANYNSTHFHGLISYHENYTGMDFWKLTSGNLAKKRSKGSSEVSFKFLAETDFDQHVFIFGTYSAINTFNHDKNNPARVSGPIVLESIPEEQYDEALFSSIPIINDKDIPPEIAAKVRSNRWEEEKSYTRKAAQGTFKERRKVELALIDENNPFIKKPRKLIGDYFCLVFSKSHKSIRKILMRIRPDMTIDFKSTKYANQQTIIDYKGNVNIFSNGLLVFKADKKLRLDYLEGKFMCKDIFGPMYGLLGGIIRDVPKEGRAVLVPFTKKFQKVLKTDIPEFIELESEAYQILDEALNLTRFFAGRNIEGEQLNIQGIFNDDKELFTQLLRQRAGDFAAVAGHYEEYYFDPNENIIRKDYWLIRKTGEAFMCGRRRYRGKVSLIGSKYIIEFRASNKEQMPVIYMIQQEREPKLIFSGINTTFSEDGRDIAGNKVFLHKISNDDIGKDAFFSEFEGNSCSIPLNSQAFKDLNSELFNLGNRLSGPFGNYLLTGPFDKNEFQNNTNRILAYSFFNSACFKAQSKGLENAIEALGELDRAFQHGFSDTILLNRELKEGGALFSAKEMIDVEELKIKPRYLKVVS